MQAREPELGEQYEAVCDSTYSEAESAAAEVLDLPLPSYFRSRSHSYLRAILLHHSQPDLPSLSKDAQFSLTSADCTKSATRAHQPF